MNVTSTTQRIVVSPADDSVVIEKAGPIGPPGEQGPQGDPGLSGDESMALHILDPSPHPAYDDMQSLSSWFQNQLA